MKDKEQESGVKERKTNQCGQSYKEVCREHKRRAYAEN